MADLSHNTVHGCAHAVGTMILTKNKVDQLGDRLRKGDVTDDDLRQLDVYRRSFGDAYEVEKLRRESIRLTQMQDIAGCRVVVADIAAQDQAVDALKNLFPKCTVVDRRSRPSHGYRAVHVIVSVDEKLTEIQVRTALQHQWAELSEKLSDMVDPAIKYGEGNSDVRLLLENLGKLVNEIEEEDVAVGKMLQQTSGIKDKSVKEVNEKLTRAQEQLLSLRQRTENLLQDKIIELDKWSKK